MSRNAGNGSYAMILVFFQLYLLDSAAGDKRRLFLHNYEQRVGTKVFPVYGIETTELVVEYMNMTFGHAESPKWDPDTQTLYWVDVLNQNVYALNYRTFKHKVKHLDCGEVNVVIPVLNSDLLLIGCRSKVSVMDWDRNTLKRIAHLDANENSNIFNEGKCDAFGRLWAGTKGPQKGDKVEGNHATLYKLERPCYRPKPQLRPVSISNGLVWALNNSLLYYIDSATNRIDAYDFDLEKGQLGGGRVILDTNEWGYKDAVPDGMTIDRDGFLWVALYHYGQVVRIDPDAGEILTVYDLPVPRVTSMTWVGDLLEDLVVTTSRRNLPDKVLAKYPLAGTIFLLRGLGTGGVTDYKFAYDSRDKCLDSTY